MEALQEAGRKAAVQAPQGLLQSERVRAELGELAEVIEGVLNQALNGSIDSWEDLGRMALEVLQAIIEKLLEAQQAATQGGDPLNSPANLPVTLNRMQVVFAAQENCLTQ